MKIRTRRMFFPLCLFALVLSFMACAGPAEVGITEDTLYEDQVYPVVEHEYLIGPADVLEIVYHYDPKPKSEAYYLAVGDVIKIEFTYHRGANREVTIRPDGNVSMPRIGDVKALGLTTEQLRDKLVELYSRDFRNPVITVAMTKYNRSIDFLRESIKTAPRGQSKLTTVRPDGWVAFPIIEDQYGQGKTLPEFRREVQAEYSKYIDHLSVTLILKIVKANLVYVMGEVGDPSYFLMEGRPTLTQVLSMAGGVLPSAEKETVLVITRDELNRPWGRLVNLKSILEEGNASRDITINQYDVVYVPKSSIARRNLWVTQYIDGLVPEFFDASYNMGGVLLQHEPAVR